MNELERLSKLGWRFVVHLSPVGGCVIQGVLDDGVKGDWDFDEAALSFNEALEKALFHVSKQQAPAGAKVRDNANHNQQGNPTKAA